MELSSSEIKKILIFCQKKPFFVLRQMEPPKKISHILGENFPSSKKIKKVYPRKFLIVWKIET